MKILHISNIKNNSGWSIQAENHLLSLHSAGVDVSARHINLLNNEREVHPVINDLLNKDCCSPEIIILNTLPSLYEKTGRAKTIGYYLVETNNFHASGWSDRINLLDGVAVPNYFCKKASLDSGVSVPIHIVPVALDIEKCHREYPTHSIRQQHPDKFLFLCVSEWTTRKNIEAIIRAFHTEFAVGEPVELVIKTTSVGFANPQQDIENRIQSIKRGLKLYNSIDRFKRDNVICGFLSETDMYSLYQSCDALVNVSKGEAFSIPTATAMAVGLPVVSVNHSGLDYVNDRNAFVVRSYAQPCYNMVDALPDLYTAAEGVWECDEFSLREQMRSVYEKKNLTLKRVQQARKDIDAYGIENVGKIYRQVLEKLF